MLNPHLLKRTALVFLSSVLVPVITPEVAQAASLVQPFEVFIDSGSLSGQTFAGTATYDSDELLGGATVVSAAEGLAVKFDFAGIAYDETDDLSFPSFPTLNFSPGGTLQGLTYSVSQGGVTFDLFGEAFQYEFSGSTASGETAFGQGTVTYGSTTTAPVPEPLTLLGSVAAVGLGYAAKRRMAAS